MCWGREIEEPRNENYSTCQSVPASLLERITTMAPMLSSFGSGFSRAAHLLEALPVGRVLAGQPLRFHGRLGCSPDLRISAARGSETILAMKKRKDLKKISTYGREDSSIHKMGLASLIWTLFCSCSGLSFLLHEQGVALLRGLELLAHLAKRRASRPTAEGRALASAPTEKQAPGSPFLLFKSSLNPF